MFCGNCGVENANGAKFCKGCGQPLKGDVNQVPKMTPPQGNAGSSVSNAATGAPKVDVSQVADKIKALPKKILIGACAAVVALIIVIVIAVNAGSTINLNEYLAIEAEGFDGYGKARVTIDWDAIEAKYGKKLSFTSQAKKEYG